ncbi:MAG: hypothetical protein E4H02_02960 [Lentisphaerales bacterium]|nr:MAG: hypothetical protein E4H02_02960 [Lentisphaerales bacterium]
MATDSYLRRLLSERGWILATTAAVAVLYVFTARTLPTNVFWGTDEGGKYLMTAGWKYDGGLRYEIPYGGIENDPALDFFPDGSLFPSRDDDGQMILPWQPWFSLVSSVPLRLFGPAGLYILPIVCGILVALLAGLMAGRQSRATAPPLVLVVGLCSPMMFYSFLFWEHVPAVCCALAGTYLLLPLVRIEGPPVERRRTRTFTGFLMLMAALALRHEMAIYMVSMLVAMVVAIQMKLITLRRPGKRGRTWVSRGGLVLPAVIAAAVLCASIVVYHAVKSPSYGPLVLTAFQSLVRVGRYQAFAEHIGQVLMNNQVKYGIDIPDRLIYLGLAGLVLCLASRLVRRDIRWALWLTGAGAVATTSLYVPLYAPASRCFHSFVLPAPWMVLALLPAADPDNNRPRPLALLTGIYVGVFVLVSFLVDRSHGAGEWGTRFLLLGYPLVGIEAAARVGEMLASRRHAIQRYGLVAIAVFLVSIAWWFSLRGTREMQGSKCGLDIIRRELEAAPGPVITDQYWIAAGLSPTFASQPIYMISPDHDFQTWLEQIGRKSRSFVWLSTQGLPCAGTEPWAEGLVYRRRTSINSLVLLTYTTGKGGSE